MAGREYHTAIWERWSEMSLEGMQAAGSVRSAEPERNPERRVCVGYSLHDGYTRARSVRLLLSVVIKTLDAGAERPFYLSNSEPPAPRGPSLSAGGREYSLTRMGRGQ